MRLGPYEVQGEVGRGGLGIVFRGKAPDGRLVALKLLRVTRRDSLARFERERRLLASLGESEGFVPLLDAGEGPQGPYLVMPFLEGGTLRERLARGPLDVDDALALAIALGRALGKAHARGIVHRDVKPENVLFDAAGRPYVADLGLAKHFREDAPGASQTVSLSRSGMTLGTAGYAAPEQSKGGEVGPPADVFALGAVLYECIAGVPAFAGDSAVEVLASLHSGSAPRLRGVPAWLAAIVTRALDAAPGKRYSDGEAFARALEAPHRRKRWPLVLPLVLVLVLVLVIPKRPERPATAEELLAGAVAALEARLDPVVAEDLARRATERDPRSAPAFVALARALERTGDVAATVKAARRATELDPRSAEAWATLGYSLISAGAPTEAEAALDRAVDLGKKTASIFAARGFVRMERDARAALEDYERAVLLDRTTHSLESRGAARAVLGDMDGALADLEAAAEIASTPAQRARVLRQRASIHKADGNFPAMIADLGRAADADPRSSEPLVELALHLESTGDLEGGLAAFDRAVGADPDRAITHAYRAALRMRLRDVAGAYEDNRRAIELDPRLQRAWVNLALAHLMRRDAPAAIVAATYGIALDPAQPVAWANRATALAELGELDMALRDLEVAIAIAPGSGDLYRILGGVHEKRGDVAAARRAYEKLLELAPNDRFAPEARQRLAKLAGPR